VNRPARGADRPRHTLGQVLGRWAIGKHWHGQARSDATFWRDGTQGESGWWGLGRESRWVLLAGWKRAGLRLAAAVAAAGLLDPHWRQPTEWALALVLGPAAGLAMWRAVGRVRLWQHRATLERPLASALAPFLGIAPRAAEAALAVEPGYADAAGGEHVAALSLPDHWAAVPDQRTRVEQVIQARLGVDVKYAWRTAQHPMVLNVTRAPVPPVRVPFADMRAEMEACPPARLLLGVTADGSRRYWDRASEDPMIAIHGGSRRGKTSLLLLIATQELRRGAERVTGIDPKRVSLLALAGCGPAVELHNDPRDVPGMWAGVARFRALVEERYDLLTDDPTREFAPALLIIDEVSMFAGMSAAHWRKVKAKSDPALPPVWDDVSAVVWMGAQANAYAVVAGQRLDYQILGGMLGSFGVRMLAGYAPQDYARLVGLPPFQRSQKPRGRFLLYAGGELDWVQLVKVDDPDGDYSALRAWVLDGRRGASDLAANGQHATCDVIGLAAGAEHLGLSVDAFRQRRVRDGAVPGEFRVGNQPAWKRADLDRWASRQAAATTTLPGADD
jgi:hypothetical protein